MPRIHPATFSFLRPVVFDSRFPLFRRRTKAKIERGQKKKKKGDDPRANGRDAAVREPETEKIDRTIRQDNAIRVRYGQ
jgi:hypothetical protein